MYNNGSYRTCAKQLPILDITGPTSERLSVDVKPLKLTRVLHKRDVRVRNTLAHKIVGSVTASAAVVGKRGGRDILDAVHT